MPERYAYEPVLSKKASFTIIGLSRSKQKRVIDVIVRLADYPTQEGDYSTRDEQDREIQHLKLGDWVVSFWADHAVRELRVLEIAEL